MKKIYILIGFTLISFSLAGCTTTNKTVNNQNNTTTTQSKTIQTLSEQIKSFISLPPEQFKSLIGQPDTILIDVRTSQEFSQGYISGAINIDIYNPNFAQQIANLDKNKHYLIYCRSGNRSKAAMNLMKQLGFKKVNDLDGGIKNWIKAGYEVIK